MRVDKSIFLLTESGSLMLEYKANLVIGENVLPMLQLGCPYLEITYVLSRAEEPAQLPPPVVPPYSI